MIEFYKKIFASTFIIILSLLLVFLVFYTAEVFLIIFAAILIAIFLSTIAKWIEKNTRFSYRWSLFLFLLIVMLTIVQSSLIAFPTVTTQFVELKENLSVSFKHVSQDLQSYDWYQHLEKNYDLKMLIPKTDTLVNKSFPVAASLLNVLGGMVGFFLIGFIGLLMSFNWQAYKKGLIRLIPQSNQKRFLEIINTIIAKLRSWLMGRVLGMLIISVMTIIGLKILGIKLAVILGLIAGLLSFIPNIGPVLSVLPAVLLGFAVSPEMALWVLVLYIGIQVVESWFLTPFIESNAIRILPTVVIFSQILMVLLFGFLGVLLATPLLAVFSVLIEECYVKDVLKKA